MSEGGEGVYTPLVHEQSVARPGGLRGQNAVSSVIPDRDSGNEGDTWKEDEGSGRTGRKEGRVCMYGRWVGVRRQALQGEAATGREDGFDGREEAPVGGGREDEGDEGSVGRMTACFLCSRDGLPTSVLPYLPRLSTRAAKPAAQLLGDYRRFLAGQLFALLLFTASVVWGASAVDSSVRVCTAKQFPLLRAELHVGALWMRHPPIRCNCTPRRCIAIPPYLQLDSVYPNKTETE